MTAKERLIIFMQAEAIRRSNTQIIKNLDALRKLEVKK